MIKFIRTRGHNIPMPARATKGSAGLDLCADLHPQGSVDLHPGQRLLIKTGWKWDASDHTNVYGRIAPRSGLAYKSGIDVMAGVIDSDYQNEIGVILINHGDRPVQINHCDRIAQLIVEQHASFIAIAEAEEMGTAGERVGGYGSTGR